MADIKVLKEIGLKEVSKKTHIEVKFLEYMINSDFAKLNRVNSIGFTKIISREYDVDFTDWLEEAKEYWDAHAPLEHDEPKIFIASKPSKLPKIIFSLLSLIFLVVILYAAYMFLDKKLNFFEDTVLKKDINYTYEETPAVSEAKKTLSEDNAISANHDVNDTDVNNTNVGAEAADINQSVVEAEQQPVVKEENISGNTQLSETAQINQNETKKDNSIPIKANVVTGDFISPNSKLWVGVIDLNSSKRRSYLTDGNISLDATEDQLITTGHGNFTLYFKGVVTEFHSMQPLKFMIKDGNITKISTDRFKQLNKGSLW